MPLTLIKGTYRIQGASPDGDSVRFYPQDPGAWAAAGLAVRANSQGGAQLRLDAIDALETHYRPVSSSTTWRQPTGLASAAADRLLELLGFRSVTRDADGTVTAAQPAQSPGYILTRFADKYGRPVSFAYAGARRGRGTDAAVHLDVAGMRTSMNYLLLQEGLVYPTFYSRLYVDLRQALADTADAARQAGRGVWAKDSTTSGFALRSRKQLTEELVILPKLFRRLADYLSLDGTGGVSLSGFSAYLATRDDRLFTVPEGQATTLDTLVSVRRQSLQLTVPPERIVFLES